MRASGILLPVSSLPSKYGIGCFSEEAYEFVDQLARAGQKYWQILPLGPTGYGDSPYQSFSTFAGNPYFIDLEAFVKEGYLDKSDCEDCDWGTNESYVDYEKIYNSRFRLLRKAFENYDCETDQEYRKFVKENAAWLEDYSLYMAIKDSLNGISWIEWPTELKDREKAALAEKREKFAKEVGFYCFQQFCFFKQWTALKAYANAKGVEMIGDIPIYVAFDSADAWAQPELFQFDKENIPGKKKLVILKNSGVYEFLNCVDGKYRIDKTESGYELLFDVSDIKYLREVISKVDYDDISIKDLSMNEFIFNYYDAEVESR